MDYSKFHGKRISDICTHNIEKSSYCHNYYTDDEGNEIFVWSDDDNLSIYYHNDIEFAESFFTWDEEICVYDEFLPQKPTTT